MGRGIFRPQPWLLLRPQHRVLSWPARMAGASLCVMAAASVRMALIPITGSGSPFVLFFSAALISALLFGRSAGFLASALGAVSAAYLFMPLHSLTLAQVSAQGALFMVEALLVSVITAAFSRSKRLSETQALALERSEAHYRVLSEVSPQGTWEANLRGEITYTNLYWQRYAGLMAAQAKGLGSLAAVAPEERLRARAYLHLCAGRTQSFQSEIRLLRARDKTYRWHLICGQPVCNEAGQVTKWVGVAVDIQGQKQAESELATAVRARDNFLSTASHELKTPLTSMQLLTQMMRRNHERGREHAYSPQKLTRLFVQIDKSVHRLTRIIDDMLDVSRISTGKLSFKFEPTNLAELIAECVDRLSGQIEAGGVAVRVDCPPEASGVYDRFRLEQVVTNLIINAICYGEGAAIDIVVSMLPGGVTLAVRDYGPGVAPGIQGIIFQQFERGTVANPSGGLGLGLYLCRQIVERHGGRIGLEAPQGPGAQFVVRLPHTSAHPHAGASAAGGP